MMAQAHLLNTLIRTGKGFIIRIDDELTLQQLLLESI